MIEYLKKYSKIIITVLALVFIASGALLLCKSPDTPVAVEVSAPDEAKPPDSGPVLGDTVNINTAGVTELMKLSGIGEVLAQRIVDYRNEHGDFKFPEELMEVKGIGEGRFDAVRYYIRLED